MIGAEPVIRGGERDESRETHHWRCAVRIGDRLGHVVRPEWERIACRAARRNATVGHIRRYPAPAERHHRGVVGALEGALVESATGVAATAPARGAARRGDLPA